MADEIRQAVRTFLSRMPSRARISNLADDLPLRTSGIVDSMGVIRLTSFLEERFGIRIEAYETGVENTDTVDAIVAFVESKLG